MAATYVKYQHFVEHLGLQMHNLDTDLLSLALSNRSPVVGTDEALATCTPITEQNGYAKATVASTYSQTTGTGTCQGTTVVWTGTTTDPAFGPFQYVILFNDTYASAPVDPVIAYWSYGSSISVNNGETFTATIGAPGTLFTIV